MQALVLWNLVGLSAVAVGLGWPAGAVGSSGVTRSLHRRVSRGAMRRAAPAASVGVVVLVLSGWPLPAFAAALMLWWVWGAWERVHRVGRSELVGLEGLAVWIENVRDVLAAGEQPIGAIAQTSSSSAAELGPAIRRLNAGLRRQDPEIALRRFAADLDDPLGDLVAVGLLVAIRRGGRAIDVLSMLAAQTRHALERRRLIEAERAPVIREVWLLTALMSVLFGAVFIFGRSGYLSTYQSAGGQLVLAAAIVGYGGLVIRVQQLARFPRPRRFLAPGRAAVAEWRRVPGWAS